MRHDVRWTFGKREDSVTYRSNALRVVPLLLLMALTLAACESKASKPAIETYSPGRFDSHSIASIVDTRTVRSTLTDGENGGKYNAYVKAAALLRGRLGPTARTYPVDIWPEAVIGISDGSSAVVFLDPAGNAYTKPDPTTGGISAGGEALRHDIVPFRLYDGAAAIDLLSRAYPYYQLYK